MDSKEFVREDTSKQVQTILLKDINAIIAEVLGERYRDYRRRWEAATNFELCGKYPIHLDLELNYGCNLRCKMCFFSTPKSMRHWEPKKRLLDLELVKRMISDGIPHGLSSIGTSVYNEPLLRKDIIEFCSWARSEGIVDIIFVTNGTLLTKEISERIIDAGITKLRFSLDAYSKELYEKIRVGANYEKTMDNIHYFLNLKKKMGKILPVTSVNFVLMEENEHEIESFKKYWSNHVDFIVVQNLLPTDHTEVHVAGTHAVAENFKCPQPWQRLIVRSDGSVIPCTYLNKHFMQLGNIHEKSIYDMWNSEFMDKLRNDQKNGLYKKYNACLNCSTSFTS